MSLAEEQRDLKGLERKDIWDKLRALGTLLASVAIPVVLIVLNSTVAVTIKDKDVSLKKLELAISILMEPAAEERTSLRSWAAEQVFPRDRKARESVLHSPVLLEIRRVGDRLENLGFTQKQLIQDLLETGPEAGLALYHRADSLQSELLRILSDFAPGDDR